MVVLPPSCVCSIYLSLPVDPAVPASHLLSCEIMN